MFTFIKQLLFISKSIGFLLIICRIYDLSARSVTLRLFVFIHFNHKSHEQSQAALIIKLLWTQSRGALVGLASHKKVPSPPNRNMKHYKPLEFFTIFGMSSPAWTNVKPLYWRLSGDGSVWTDDWNIYQYIQKYIKQPDSSLGFDTAQRWKSSFWPGCGKWNGQGSAAMMVVSSTILAQHKLCLTSETMRLLKMSPDEQITSVIAIELVWWRSWRQSLLPMRSTKVCKAAIFWFVVSSFKTQ